MQLLSPPQSFMTPRNGASSLVLPSLLRYALPLRTVESLKPRAIEAASRQTTPTTVRRGGRAGLSTIGIEPVAEFAKHEVFYLVQFCN